MKTRMENAAIPEPLAIAGAKLLDPQARSEGGR
jgi:hypothetical protein